MIDQRDVERAAERFRLPEGSFERLTHRRDRKRRDRRIRAGVLGIAVAIAMGWWVADAIRNAEIPAEPPGPAVDLGIFEPVAGRIVYGDRDGIWGVNPAAPEEDPVPLASGNASPLGWSRDGTELLVGRTVRSDGVTEQILSILHADGTETPVITEPIAIGGATISPDGSRVVFSGTTATAHGLHAVDVDTGQVEVLLEAGEDSIYDPVFSPDGTQIAYAAGGGDHSHHIWVMNADGSDAHEIVFNETTDGVGHVHGLAWSPTGDLIALGLDSNGIFTFAPDGSGFTRVIEDGDTPYWSPDGSQIAYSLRWPFTNQPEPRPLAIADADGSHERAFDVASSGPWHPGHVAATDPTETSPVLAELRHGAEFIVFDPMGTGLDRDLAARDPATGEVRTIVETDGIVDCPDIERCRSFVREAGWSADGRWLAFEVTHANLDGPSIGPCAPTVGVWVTNATGELRQLTTPCDAPPPGSEAVEEVWEWSPVGARIAYSRVDGETDELFVIDPSDGSRTSLGTAGIPPRNGLTASPGWALEWSPDGTRIAYADEGSVSAVDASGGNASSLAASFEDIVDVAWSPDGAHILVHDQGRYRIQVMNADGSDLHVVLEEEDACCSTAWSPNGDRILYMLSVTEWRDNPDGSWHSEVWTISADGSNPIQIFDSSTCDMYQLIDLAMEDTLPVWSPDGAQVAYMACDAWVVANADGVGPTQPIDPLVWRSWYSSGLTGEDLAGNGMYDH